MHNIKAAHLGNESFDGVVDTGASGDFANAYRSEQGYKDKSEHFELLRSTYDQDRVAQRVIETPIYDALANWRDSDNSALNACDEELNTKKHLSKAIIEDALLGQSVILPILENSVGRVLPFNQKLDTVVDRGEVTIKHLCVYSENVCFDEEVEKDIRSDCFGKPKKIEIGLVKVHPSRVIILGNNNRSYFDSVKSYLADYHEARRRKQIAVRRNNAFFLKSDWDKILQMLRAQEQAQGKRFNIEDITQERARALFKNLNDHNIAVGNLTEELENFQLNNIDDLIKNVDQEMQTLSGVSGIPYSKLWGKSSSSLGNNSQESFENYNQELKNHRSVNIRPVLEELDTFISKVKGFEYSPNDWTFNPTIAEETRLVLGGEINDATD